MGEREGDRSLDTLRRIARVRVSLGFAVAAVAFWFATPDWRSLGVGALVAACGETLRVWAAGHIRKGQEVTASGPYRYTRHPLYLGSFIMGIGFVVAAANLVVAGVVVGYLLIMFWVAITLEEATLRREFGADYDRYAGGQLASGRSFELALAIKNGEQQTLLGFAAALSVLALKVWLSARASGI